MQFQNPFDYTPPEGERMDPKSKTEQVGYVSAKVQVENMLRAGIRLDAYRKGMYDYAPEEEVPDDAPIDPLRSPGVDLVDIDSRLQAVQPLPQPDPPPSPVPDPPVKPNVQGGNEPAPQG